MILFRLISWPYVRKHAVRSVLTVTGIVLGVGVFVGMHAANDSVFGAFQQTVERVAGATQLQVTAGGPGFDEEVLERVQALPEVAVAAPVIEAVAATGLSGEGNLLILGVDMTGDRSLREYDLESGDAAMIEDPLVFLAQPDSLMVTSDFARRNRLSANDRVPLETVDGRKDFVVRGLLSAGGLSSAFGGNIAIMDIYAAQHVFGRGRKFDRIDIALAPGISIADGERVLREELGPGFQVQTPATRGQGFESLLRIYRIMLRFSSVAALVIGMFIIYNSFAIAVTQRRREIGILRALGATRRQVALLFLGESALGGLIGSVAGVGAGYALAAIAARRATRLVQGTYGVSQGEVDVTAAWPLIALAIAIGVATSIVAAALPARTAATVDPVKALQKGRVQVLSEGENRFRTIAAAILGAIGVALLASDTALRAFYVGYLCLLASAMLLAPILSVALVRALRPVLVRLRPVEGALAADSLMGAPRRTSATVAALMLAVALVVGLAGTAAASYKNIMEYASHALNPDLFVTASPTLTGRDYRFPDAMTAQLEAVAGVREVQRMRQGRVAFGTGQILLMATDVEKVGRTSRRTPLDGDPDDMYRRTAAGEGVIGSEHLASMFDLRVGDVLELPYPGGLLKLPLVGVVRDYADQHGSVMLDLAVYRKYWKDDAVDLFRVYVARDDEPEAVRSRILDRFSADRRLFVLSSGEVLDYVTGLTDEWFAMTWVQLSIAILVAVLGIVNSLTVTIADRRRELGVLQAVGGLRSQVRGTLWMEAATVGFISVLLGVALGAVHLYFVLQVSYRDFPGLKFDYAYPYAIALLLFPTLIAAAFLSALGPAEAAVRGSLVQALEYE
jgi:putative ABC transport system permease protein